MSMQIDAYLKREQIGILFVHVVLLHGGSRGGWVGQGVPDQFLGMTSITFFPASWFGSKMAEGSTEEMPENVHFCIQKAATHSHFIQSTPF